MNRPESLLARLARAWAAYWPFIALIAFLLLFGSMPVWSAEAHDEREVAPRLVVDVAVDPIAIREVQDCDGNIIPVPTQVPACLLLVGHDRTRVRIESLPAAKATLAGTSSKVRAVYARTAEGKRGPKIGEVDVGTVAKPVGITCDLEDTFRAGSVLYARLTDPRAPAGGYATGCAP